MKTMEKMYRAQRHLRRPARVLKMQRFRWGVVCLLVLAVLAGLWIQVQRLASENSSLRQQLVIARSKPVMTCTLTGSWKADQTSLESVTVDGAQRQFYVHTPAGFTSDNFYPVVMFYVGRGGNAAGAEQNYGIDALPAITVYPVPTTGGQNMTAWQGAPYSSGADDVAFTSSILASVEKNLCIDTHHIYAVGMSNGGGFVSLLSCKLPGRFAAYAVVAGAFYPPAGNCVPPRPAPIINVHGDKDTTVPYFGSLARELPPIESWIGARAAHNNCRGEAVTTYPSANVVLTTWNDCSGGATVENVRVEGVGHQWGLVSNQSIWHFLARFSL